MVRRGWIAAAGTVVLGLLLWVTSSRPVTVLGSPRDPFELPRATIQPVTRTQPAGPTRTPTVLETAPPAHGGTLVGLLLEILAVLVVVTVLGAFAYYVVRLWRYRQERPREEAFETLPDVADSVVEDAESQFAALAEGQPRNAIVACWLRLEEAVASSGLPRRPSETSAEFTARVLDDRSLDADAIHELAELYRVARFSTHALGEPDRHRAVEALRRLHADLVTTRRAGERQSARAATDSGSTSSDRSGGGQV